MELTGKPPGKEENASPIAKPTASDISDFGKDYCTDVENKIINDLKKNKVDLVVEPKPLDQNYLIFTKLRNYISTYYRKLKNTGSYNLFSR